MAAYETSSKTLRAVLAHPSLNLGNIDDVTLDLQSALADQQEISKAITDGMGVATGEEDLEEELMNLVEEDRRERETIPKVHAASTSTEPTPQHPVALPAPVPGSSRKPAPDWAAINAATEERRREEKGRAAVERMRLDAGRERLIAD